MLKKFVLDIPFEWRAWASTQKVRWNSAQKVSVYEGETLPETLRPFAAQTFSWEWVQEQTLNSTWDIPNITPIWVPRAHQIVAKQAIQKAYQAGSPGFLLADDVGLGKTISAWSFILEQQWATRILIVAPLAVLAHWRNTILKMGHGNKHILLINYDRLGKLFETPDTALSSSRKKGKQKRLAREGQAPEMDIVLFDESHKCKNITSARSQLAKKIIQQSQFSIWASATAGQDPLELAYLTPLLAFATPSKVSSMKDFEIWCQNKGLGVTRGDFGKWQWKRNPEDIERIKKWLFQDDRPLGIRRLPSQIAGWKELERQPTLIDLDGESMQAYEKEWHIFRQEEMQDVGKKKTSSTQQNALTRRLRFRQKSSWLRIKSTMQMVEDYLENNKQVAVSVAFHETLNEMMRICQDKKIPCVCIHGKMSAEEKEGARLAFQKESVPLIFFTVEEGISLHQGEYGSIPRALLVHDLRWSAIQMAQIEGRCHRDGFFAPSVWLLASGTIEEDIAKILSERITTMKAMMGDDTQTMEELERLFTR